MSPTRRGNFIIYKEETSGNYLMKLFVNEGVTSGTETTTTLVQWKDGVVDTIESVIQKANNNSACMKVSVNGDVKYDLLSDPKIISTTIPNIDRLIEITK
jgi:hypothetical protein